MYDVFKSLCWGSRIVVGLENFTNIIKLLCRYVPVSSRKHREETGTYLCRTAHVRKPQGCEPGFEATTLCLRGGGSNQPATTAF